MPENKVYGTFGGRFITEAEIEAMADEAEAGYDLTKLRRRPGRPLTGSAPAEVVPAGLNPEPERDSQTHRRQAHDTELSSPEPLADRTRRAMRLLRLT
jgi:hypothetical protein